MIQQASSNIKQIRLKLNCEESQRIVVEKKGPGEVTAADITPSAYVEVMNPEQVICTLTRKDATLDMVATVTRGRGFKMASELKRKDASIGVITLDCNYSPVERVACLVERGLADEKEVRENRLGLLQRIADLALGAADMSKLEGF